MLLSGHQPVYLPGIILFNKIALSEAFMFVGHVQYSRKSWQTRNYIRSGDKPIFLSVPVTKAGQFGVSINETEIEGNHWKRKHLASIRQAYAKRPFFDFYYPGLESVLLEEFRNLGEMNMALIRTMLTWFRIETPVLDSRSLPVAGHKTDMLISMCKVCGADAYLSNIGSRAYVDEALMLQAGLRHYWQDFSHPTYNQGEPFLPNLSALDILFNLGPAARDLVVTSGRISKECPAS